MGSITEALAAFADHVARGTIANRPTVFVVYIDIWGTPRGEIGVADPQDISHVAFALLAPWALCPSLGEAWLVVDAVDALEVTNLKATFAGMFEPHWRVPYSMADDGTLSFGDPESSVPPAEVGQALAGAKTARLRGVMWQSEHSLETMIPVVEEMLNR